MGGQTAQQAHVLVNGPGLEGRPFVIRDGVNMIGRLPANDLILSDNLVSRHHARITFCDGVTTIQDLGSHNGTFVNDKRIFTAQVQDDDVIRIGSFTLKYRHGPAPTVTPVAVDRLRTIARRPKNRTHPQPPPGLSALLLRLVDLSHASTADNPLQRAVAGIEDAFSASEATVIRLGRGGQLTVAERRCAGPDEGFRDRNVVEWVVQQRFPVAVTNPSEDARFGKTACRHPAACVPILAEGEVLGALFVSRPGPAFSIPDLDGLQGAAHLIGALLVRMERDRAPWSLPSPVDAVGAPQRLRQPGVAISLSVVRDDDVQTALEAWSELLRDWAEFIAPKNGYIVTLDGATVRTVFLDAGLDDGVRAALSSLNALARRMSEAQWKRARAGVCWAEVALKIWTHQGVRRLVGAGTALEGAMELEASAQPGEVRVGPEVARKLDLGLTSPLAEYPVSWRVLRDRITVT